ncbi:hypothetical protein [Nonomuraea sp. NPDC046570]|uniref:hypothetical protein n=1 Tax=Nonomuraea sp. NPDC046570 TaxID=3155255 RepID=UPI0033F896A2
MGITRRGLARGTLLGLAASALPTPAEATVAEESFLTRPLSTFDQRRYFTYPTHNGFSREGARLVLGQLEAGTTSLWELDPRTNRDRFLARFSTPPSDRNPFVWWNVHGGRLVTCAENAVWLIDLTAARPEPVRLYTPPAGRALSVVVNLHPGGDRVLCSHYPAPITTGPTTAVEIDLDGGGSRDVFEGGVFATHFQYSARDPAWIGYSLGGGVRAWATHPVHAPRGELIWDQAAAGVPLGTHEVWKSRAETGCLIVGVGGPAAGLWMAYPDDRPDRLLQRGPEGANGAYNHCDISADGRWAVVDTNGRQGSAAGSTGAVALVDLSGEHPPRTLGLAGWGAAHPGHPHPSFSPDGRRVAYTDTEAATGRTRVMLAEPRGSWTAAEPAWQAEAESLPVTVTGGTSEVFADPQCGGGHGRLFRPGVPGGSIAFEVPAPAPGRRRLRLRLKRHYARGVYQLSVNGAAVGAPIDLYSPVAAYAELEFPRVLLRPGANEVRLTHVGRHPDATGTPGDCAVDRIGLR